MLRRNSVKVELLSPNLVRGNFCLHAAAALTEFVGFALSGFDFSFLSAEARPKF